MRHTHTLAAALTGAAIAVGALMAPTAATAAPAPRPAASPNHQFCFATGRHLCMATRHAGINSAMVLRVDGHTAAQAITWHTGQLRIDGHPGQCVGADTHLVEARSARCNGGHGIRWRLIVFPFRGVGFVNVAATRADPNHVAHYLLAATQAPGQILAIGTNLRLPHVWRDCAGHCTRPAATRLHPDGRIFGGSNPDCNQPVVTIAKRHIHGPHPHVTIAWSGHLRCKFPPAPLTSFMTLQKQNPHNSKWELLKVTKTRNGVRPITINLWTRDIKGPPHRCVIARLRANWNSLGDSSTGEPGETSVCSPVLQITSCGSHGADVVKRGSNKRGCPHPLLT